MSELLTNFNTRRALYDELCNRQKAGLQGRNTCPCCGYPTLGERGNYVICRMCRWEDDNQDDQDADEMWGGPNDEYSLTQARQNYERYLSIYGPEKASRFPENPARLELKRQLVAVYEQMLSSTEEAQIEALKQTERKFTLRL